jgi:hypothetical protein
MGIFFKIRQDFSLISGFDGFKKLNMSFDQNEIKNLRPGLLRPNDSTFFDDIISRIDRLHRIFFEYVSFPK